MTAEFGAMVGSWHAEHSGPVPSAAVPVQESGTSVAVPEQVAATSLAEPEQLALDAVLRHVDLLRLSSAEISAVIHASRCVAAQLSSTGAVYTHSPARLHAVVSVPAAVHAVESVAVHVASLAL